jgi:hypothetical protein
MLINWTSGTTVVATSRFLFDSKWVTLIDTPGFDDTYKSDADILQEIARFLAITYAEGVLLNGIILLQQINHNRVQGGERRRTRLFEKVCGPNAFPNVVIATTMWSELNDESIGNKRVQERQDSEDFWGAMVAKGAKVARHDNTQTSARNIVKMLVNKPKTSTQMQDELFANGGVLSKTSAGQQMNSDIDETSRKLLEELQELRNEISKSNTDKAEMQQEIRELRNKLNDLAEEKHTLENTNVCDFRFFCSMGLILKIWKALPQILGSIVRLAVLLF